MLQILSVTGDNASNNDKMIQYLGDSLEDFPGPANQTRCFVHTVNLIAKSVLKPFDVKKTKDVQAFNNVAHALADSEEHDPEESAKQATGDDEEEGKEDEEENNKLDASLEPIRSTLLKVCLRLIDPNPKLMKAE